MSLGQIWLVACWLLSIYACKSWGGWFFMDCGFICVLPRISLEEQKWNCSLSSSYNSCLYLFSIKWTPIWQKLFSLGRIWEGYEKGFCDALLILGSFIILLVVVQSKHSVVVAANWTTCSLLLKLLIGKCIFFNQTYAKRSRIHPSQLRRKLRFPAYNLQYLPMPRSNIISQ